MTKFSFRRLSLKKLFPLAISRGVSTGSENLFVFASDGTHAGIGEASPSTGTENVTAGRGEQQLTEFLTPEIASLSRTEVWDRMREAGIDPPAMAAVDVALWDLFAKQCGRPLFEVFGLPKPTVPTSVTIGINPPEVVRERVPKILSMTGAKCLKVKLGSKEGIEADQVSFLATLEAAAPFAPKLRVDANGGWSLSDAKVMLRWLAERGVDYVEQPLVEGAEDQLPQLFAGRPLPLYVDESCRFAKDVPRLAGGADGVNLKLMKCGGITEALRIIAAARAHGMGTMIGCMSESSIGIAAGAALGACFDHIDLDSHLNLNPDPAEGLGFVEGVVMPPDAPGHGASLKPEFAS